MLFQVPSNSLIDPTAPKNLQIDPIQLSLVHGTSHHVSGHGMTFLSTGKGTGPHDDDLQDPPE